jgi:hypothetical protein
MLSKQLTTKLREEQERERESQQNVTHLSATQCDRLIRTVSCKVSYIKLREYCLFALSSNF